jgi:hypothetical protein
MDRLEKLEMITERLMRRTHKKAIGLITPYPISNAVFGESIEGVVLRYMFPCDGVISKGMIRFGVKPKKEVTVKVEIFNDEKSSSKGFVVDRKLLAVEPNLSVSGGDCLTVSISSSEVPVTEVWIAFLWTPLVKDVEAKSFLITELEKDVEEQKVKSLEGSMSDPDIDKVLGS